MQLTAEDIEEFARIWQAEFHEKLSPDEARREAERLIALCELLLEPVSSPHTEQP